MIEINNIKYNLIENYKDGFDLDAVKEKYTEYFEPYDFIIGDWSYGKLRLKNPKTKFPPSKENSKSFSIAEPNALNIFCPNGILRIKTPMSLLTVKKPNNSFKKPKKRQNSLSKIPMPLVL